jgi:hypothetical protein
VSEAPADDSRLAALEAELDELQRESEARRTELRALAAELPAVMSRRALLRATVGDLRAAPDKRGILARGVRKLGRAPRALWRRLRGTTPA